MVEYEQALAHADSLAACGAADSAQVVRLLSDLHHRYRQAQEKSEGKLVRLVSNEGSVPWKTIIFIIVLSVLLFKLLQIEEREQRKERQRTYAIRLTESEQYLRDNEREMAELEAYLDRLALTDDTRDEVKLSIAALMARNDQLRDRIDSLREQLRESQKRALPPELTLLSERDHQIRLLDEQVRLLSAELLERDALLSSLHRHPRFLSEADWTALRALTDRAYDYFSDRLAAAFPQLTVADLQLCLLMRLRFTNAQIATLTAVSPSSVSQQRFRLKKRLMQTAGTSMREGETIDGFIWRF